MPELNLVLKEDPTESNAIMSPPSKDHSNSHFDDAVINIFAFVLCLWSWCNHRIQNCRNVWFWFVSLGVKNH